ncbi:MAG: cell wall-binding repeat-containing protein, partial [Acidimicrobiales bacterium]
GPVQAILVGGEEALSPTVVTDLIRAGLRPDQVFRLSGPSPADTAKLVAETFTELERVTNRPVPKTAVVLDPTSREAAAAGALAAGLRYPVLFAGRDTLPAATAAAISGLGIVDTLVIGGPGTISDAVLRQLPAATRVGGADLYGTTRAVAAEAVARGLPANVAYVVDGERPIDGALAGAAVARLGGTLVVAPGADTAAASGGVDRVVVVRSVADGGPGYRLVASDGGVFSFGGARFLGSTGAVKLARPVVGMASVPGGYWLVGADGGVFAFGEAGFHGSAGALKLNQPIVAMAATPSGLGYWLVGADGGVFAFGDARFHGSTGALKLNRPIVAIAASPTGKGYYLVASDGGVFAFGDAVFRGSSGALKLNRPIVSASVTRSGRGYHLVASDGGVFAYGDAVFRGSTGAIKLNRPIVSVVSTPDAGGYYLIASDGGVFAFGVAPFLGSAGALRLAKPIVGASG